MDFEQLRIFMILAEEGTYLGAANRMATSRSRVRRKLDQLEREAGTLLISRNQGILRVTPAGEMLVRRGRELLEDADRLIEHVHEIGHAPTGRLKIAMPAGPPPVGWERIRASLQRRFPDLRIEVFVDPNPAHLLVGTAEVAVTFDEVLPRGCSAIELGCYPLRLLVGARYLAEHGSPSSIEDLDQHRVAIWRSTDRTVGRIPLEDGRSLDLDPHFTTNDPALLARLAIEGAFIVYMPAMPHLTDPSLKSLFDDELVESVRERLAIPDILADLPRIKELAALTQQMSDPAIA